VPRLLAGMGDVDNFYFDSISQIVMDHWTDRRVTLVGDAAYGIDGQPDIGTWGTAGVDTQ